MRNTTYKDRRREKLFPGEGQVLSPEKERSPSHVNQSQLHKSTQLNEMIDEVDNPPGMLLRFNFGPQVYPMGSIVIALVSPSIGQSVRSSVFKYLRDRSLVFF